MKIEPSVKQGNVILPFHLVKDYIAKMHILNKYRNPFLLPNWKLGNLFFEKDIYDQWKMIGRKFSNKSCYINLMRKNFYYH